MKVAVLIARILLGLVFVFFGLNAFFNFLHAPMPPGLAGQFTGALFASHFYVVPFGFQILGGLGPGNLYFDPTAYAQPVAGSLDECPCASTGGLVRGLSILITKSCARMHVFWRGFRWNDSFARAYCMHAARSGAL